MGMAVAFSLVLMACGNQQGSSPSSLMSSPKVQEPSIPTSQQLGQVVPKPDLTLASSNYVDINAEPAGMALTYIVTSRSAAPKDEDKLNWLSPTYYNETDAFKKKDIAKAELLRIDSTLDQYRKNNYYVLPVSAYSKKPLGLTNVSVSSYDFNSKSFPLTSYGQYCWAGSLRNQQGATLKILASNLPCGLPVADDAQAKIIEAARSQNALGMQGTLYLFVQGVDSGTALAVATHAHIELVDTQNNGVLASFDF